MKSPSQIIEDDLGVTLPQDYCEFLSALPEELFDPRCVEIFTNIREVIDWTRSLWAGTPTREPLGKQFVAIGHSGCGDIYCLDMTQDPSPVLMWNSELEDFEDGSDSIASWCDEVLEEL